MGQVKIVRKGNGEVFKSKANQYVFVKEGVHFALTEAQMCQMKDLIEGLNDGSLTIIDPDSPDMAKGPM